MTKWKHIDVEIDAEFYKELQEIVKQKRVNLNDIIIDFLERYHYLNNEDTEGYNQEMEWF